jgi:hypothetical protein
MVVGGKDVDVLPNDSKQIYERAPEPKKLLEVAGMDHDYKNNPALVTRVNEAIIDFMGQYL